MARSIKINGVTYADMPFVQSPDATSGEMVEFYELSEADVTPGDVRNGVKFGGASGIDTGEMPEIEPETKYISSKNQQIEIEAGIHETGGKVAIADAEIAKIIPDNIRANVSILGQTGNSKVVNTAPPTGKSGAGAGQLLDGFGAWVNGQWIDGNYSGVSVSQDPVTKVVTIQ